MGLPSPPGKDARLTPMAPTHLAFDSAGNLLYAENGYHRVRRIDAATRLVSAVAGTGSAGAAADFSDAASSPLRRVSMTFATPSGMVPATTLSRISASPAKIGSSS